MGRITCSAPLAKEHISLQQPQVIKVLLTEQVSTRTRQNPVTTSVYFRNLYTSVRQINKHRLKVQMQQSGSYQMLQPQELPIIVVMVTVTLSGAHKH
jgi:hypothetical protein